MKTPEVPQAISSPDYPGNYPNNVTFRVSIASILQAHIEHHFLDLALTPSCKDNLIISGGKLNYKLAKS